MSKRFPVMASPGYAACSIPWVAIAPFDRQAQANHGGQTLEELAKRGGLTRCEIEWMRRGDRWRDHDHERLRCEGDAWVKRVITEERLAAFRAPYRAAVGADPGIIAEGQAFAVMTSSGRTAAVLEMTLPALKAILENLRPEGLCREIQEVLLESYEEQAMFAGDKSVPVLPGGGDA